MRRVLSTVFKKHNPYEIGTWAGLPFLGIWQYTGRLFPLDEHCPRIHILKGLHILV